MIRNKNKLKIKGFHIFMSHISHFFFFLIKSFIWIMIKLSEYNKKKILNPSISNIWSLWLIFIINFLIENNTNFLHWSDKELLSVNQQDFNRASFQLILFWIVQMSVFIFLFLVDILKDNLVFDIYPSKSENIY